jgi:hypothetical protein
MGRGSAAPSPGLPAVASWTPGRLDIFGSARPTSCTTRRGKPAKDDGTPSAPGNARRHRHQAARCDQLGCGRLDIFGVGTDRALNLSAAASTSPPVVASWGRRRLDIYRLGSGADGRGGDGAGERGLGNVAGHSYVPSPGEMLSPTVSDRCFLLTPRSHPHFRARGACDCYRGLHGGADRRVYSTMK